MMAAAFGAGARAGLVALAIASMAMLGGCEKGVTQQRLETAGQHADDWLTNGRTYGEQRFSPLADITQANVGQLGLAWQAPLESSDMGIEATPLVADGVLYVTSTYSRVFAFDAATGKLKWKFDPKVSRDWLRQACCKAVNRGVALWKDKVYLGVIDGRLIALDAKTGAQVWSADTTDHKPWYSITGAPRVVKGRVIIGNGGADFGMRGFFSAYDADTGKLAWRFYIVPHDPKLGPQESPALEAAVKTWDPKRNWSIGGGGNPWDGMAYDPELDLLYVGAGNAGPYDPRIRNPGGGDQLYISSILAVKPDTGQLVWHYQTTPGDQWDFTATGPMILADVKIGGRDRKVLMQAPKNGFFYVLDRATGELLSAEKYARVTWADHVDLKTGRPVLNPAADYTKGRAQLFPSPYGAHNWQAMAFSPRTGLVYIPMQDVGWVWDPLGQTWFSRGSDGASLSPDEASDATTGLLVGWDPKAGKPAWTVHLDSIMNGGALVTASDLLVQGTQSGEINFYDAVSGRLLRRIEVGTGIVAPPVTYRIGGVQYLAIAAGWNGVEPKPGPADRPPPYDNASRIIVLKLGGGPVPMAARRPAPAAFNTGFPVGADDEVMRGAKLYRVNCARCHGFVGERVTFPDLRRMSADTLAGFDDIVLGGAYKANGMASFADTLTPKDTQAIRTYLGDWVRRGRPGGPTPGGPSASLETVH